MFEAQIIGEWARPHPDVAINPNLEPIRTTLYERPDDSAIPKTVTVNSINEDGEPITKEVPFHDSILDAACTCDGCGEPFGQQIKIKRDMWVSPTQVTYMTNRGKLRFCQDVFACSRRAADRLGTKAATQQMASTVINHAAEALGQNGLMPGYILCATPSCSESFFPVGNQMYHSPKCRDDYKASLVPRKTSRRENKPRGVRKGSTRGRKPKEAAEAATV